MKEPTKLQKQQYKRFTEILETGKWRYFEATGNYRGYRGGTKGQDYLTDEERQEASRLMRQIFVISSNDVSVHNQEKTTNLSNNSFLLKE